MAFKGTMGGAVFHAFADLMPIRGCVGMDTGAISGKGEAVLEGKKDCSGQTVGPEFPDPGSKAGECEHHHKDKGTDNLCLIFGGPSDCGMESGKVIHDRVQIQKAEFFTDRAEFKIFFLRKRGAV